MKGFKIEEAFPDIKSNPYHWRVDPYEPNRVWFTIRTTATHTGPLNFGMSTYKATSALSALGERVGLAGMHPSQAAMCPRQGSEIAPNLA